MFKHGTCIGHVPNVASGGVLVDKTPEATRSLIANMATNSQQFGTRHDVPIRK